VNWSIVIDRAPISQSAKLLLSAGSRVTNTNLKWNEARTRTANQGESPTLIEPVTGTLVLRDLKPAKTVAVSALDGAGRPIGEPVQAKKTGAGWEFSLGATVTTWYYISVQR